MSKTNCVNIAKNQEKCPCTAVDCERHAVCCECLSAHMGKDALPSCLKANIQNSRAFREHIAGVVEQANS